MEPDPLDHNLARIRRAVARAQSFRASWAAPPAAIAVPAIPSPPSAPQSAHSPQVPDGRIAMPPPGSDPVPTSTIDRPSPAPRFGEILEPSSDKLHSQVDRPRPLESPPTHAALEVTTTTSHANLSSVPPAAPPVPPLAAEQERILPPMPGLSRLKRLSELLEALRQLLRRPK